MTETFDIKIDLKENKNVQKILHDNLKKFNESLIGTYESEPFCIYSINEDNEVIGGVKGDILGSLCRVCLVWVHENYRGKRLGTALFQKLEQLAKDKQCDLIQLDTTEFQARNFYEKLGFTVVATLPNNFIGHKSYILRKILNHKESDIPKSESNRFFQESQLMILAANKLKEYPILMKQCSILYHYSIELLLKGCDIWKNSRRLPIHDLCKLLKRVPFINLNDKELKQLRIINDYFNYRYPLSESVFEQMKVTLEKNAEEDMLGTLPLPTEIGTYDLEIAENLYGNILAAMPSELQNLYNEIGENIKNYKLLV